MQLSTSCNGALIVTGGSSGMGKAVLDRCSERFSPVRVINIDIHSSPPCDVRNFSDVMEAMENFVLDHEVNYLFSGAGVYYFIDPATRKPLDLMESPIETFRQMVDINLTGTINVLTAFCRLLKKRQHAQGRIVVVSSNSAYYSDSPHSAVYDATKAGITRFAKSIVPFLAPHGRVNIISPGAVRTRIGGWNPDFSVSQEGLDLVKRGQDADLQKLGCEISLTQIADIVEFLFFSDHAMNGADILIDQGMASLVRSGYEQQSSCGS